MKYIATQGVNRRQALKGALSGIAGVTLGSLSRARAQGAPALKSISNPCGLRLGICVSKSRLQDASFASGVTGNFNLVVPESEMKWAIIHPAQETYAFAQADWIVNFALNNRLSVHGHNLCWNTGNPAWLASTLTKQNAESILTKHIATVAGHFAGQLESWDVVNEPIGIWSKRPDGLYPGPWLDFLGPQYIDIAFHAAAAADPQAMRIINIHNVENADAASQSYRTAAYNLIQGMVKRGVPIQGVGIESHLDGWRPLGGAPFDAFVKSLHDLGVQVMISELDVNDTHIPGDAAARDKAVAQVYYNYVTEVVRAGQMKRLTLWSLTDKNNWMNYIKDPRWQSTDPNFGTHRAAIFDEKMQPSPAYSSMASALQQICSSNSH